MWWKQKWHSFATVVNPRYTVVVGLFFHNFTKNAGLLVILEENAMVVVYSSNMSAKKAMELENITISPILRNNVSWVLAMSQYKKQIELENVTKLLIFAEQS